MTEGAQVLIHKLRLQRGWSQEQLAEISGLSPRTIQRLEKGQTASTESLKALAAAFDVHFSRLKESDMPTPLNPDVRADETLALAHVRNVKQFYLHLVQYMVVIGALAVANVLTYPRYLWVIWPALGWGLGVAAHGLRVFDKIPFLNGEWERRQVEKHLGRRL